MTVLQERIHAPDFTGATAWLNVVEPVSIRQLRGQLVVLDFWTYCCINCLHVLPILRDLEERHRDDPLVVIGVHSAKFDAEKDAGHLLAAMRRYGVHHPVAVDSEQRIWSSYAVRSWPTLIVIRPDGTLASIAPGEPDPDVLEGFIQQELALARGNGTLAKAPLRLTQPREEAPRPLDAPGKIAHGGGRLYVADSGHHRVLILDGNGQVTDVIGTGLRGLREGAFDQCALDDPQGLAAAGDLLYIADDRAHVVLEANLATRRLRRIAGTGELGRAPVLEKAAANQTALRSPWDLAVRGHELYVALAGSHQVALIDLAAGTIEPIAGNGREAQLDGTGLQAAMAQPSGLSLQGDVLYVADSESSGVRAIYLRARKVYSLAGGPGLFDFGDKVGVIEPGMLQHPLAVAATASSGLLVADTYNDKIKRFSPDGLRLDEFYSGDGELALDQPAGLCVLPDGQVLIADTNHHRLLRVSADGAHAFEFPVTGAPAPQPGVVPAARLALPAPSAGWFTATIAAQAGTGLAPGDGQLLLTLQAPEGYALSRGAPWSCALEVSRGSDLLQVSPEFLRGDAQGGGSERIAVNTRSSHREDLDSELIVTVRSVACDARDHASCYPVQNSFRVPLRLLVHGQREARFTLPVVLAVGSAR